MGSYSWIGPDGVNYEYYYMADEEGYRLVPPPSYYDPYSTNEFLDSGESKRAETDPRRRIPPKQKKLFMSAVG